MANVSKTTSDCASLAKSSSTSMSLASKVASTSALTQCMVKKVLKFASTLRNAAVASTSVRICSRTTSKKGVAAAEEERSK